MSDEADQTPSANSTMRDIAEGLVDGNVDHFPFSEKLDLRDLDFSVDSLNSVDAYLRSVHKSLPRKLFGGRNFDALSADSATLLILRIGAYAGEVRRRNSTSKLQWFTFQEASKVASSLKEAVGDSPDLRTSYLLVSDDKTIWFPLNKVFKCIADGDAESMIGLARVAIAPPAFHELQRS